jgi:hypothetical protein
MEILWALGWVASGFALARVAGEALHPFEDRLWRAVLDAGLPVMLFALMAGTALPAEPPWRLWLAYFGASALALAAGFLAARAGFACARPQATVAGLATAYGNTTLVGVPLIPALLGPEAAGPLLLLLLAHAPLGSATAVALLEGAAGPETLRAAVRACIQPIPLSMAAGFLWAAAGPSLPMPIERAFAGVSAVTAPAALGLLGFGLARREAAGPLSLSLATAATKLVVHPALVFGACGFLGVADGDRTVLTLVAALPTGINVFLLAELHGAGSGAASQHVLVSSLGCVATLSAWFWWLH